MPFLRCQGLRTGPGHFPPESKEKEEVWAKLQGELEVQEFMLKEGTSHDLILSEVKTERGCERKERTFG